MPDPTLKDLAARLDVIEPIRDGRLGGQQQQRREGGHSRASLRLCLQHAHLLRPAVEHVDRALHHAGGDRVKPLEHGSHRPMLLALHADLPLAARELA